MIHEHIQERRVDPSRASWDSAGDSFRNGQFSQDEIVQFVIGHTGYGNVAMNQPSEAQVNEVLNKAKLVRLDGQNAEEFVYSSRGDRIRVVVNDDISWKSTAYKIGQ